MALTWRCLSLLASLCVTPSSGRAADRASHHLPPPTQLSHEWLDPFTVNVSWHVERPSSLSEDCKIEFSIHPLDKDKKNDDTRTERTYFTESRLTEEDGADQWNYTIFTTSPCSRDVVTDWRDSEPVIATVSFPKRRAKLVKDFECLLERSGMNCSWTPENKTLNLTLSYRRCGCSAELLKTLETFYRRYRSEQRDGSYLKAVVKTAPCISAANETHFSTFKPLLVVRPPNLTITQEQGYLQLHWTRPEVGECAWIYNLCYKECNVDKGCLSISTAKAVANLSYAERCLYEFQFNVTATKYTTTVFSHTVTATYGTNKPPDETRTVVAVILPLILSLSVVLSCCCFRRHRHIICPVIPDPSVIFKEMLIKGNKELKPTESVYHPKAEEVETKISLINQNSLLEQNS